ncbi:MAG TPA: N-acetyltransferase [Alphaproteobacteria bacterium]|nr:N-acetyltransferase [Alphaproteobacteria bacterium]
MIIREENESDIDAVRDIIDSAFRSKPYSSGTEPLIMDALRGSGAATVSLVADENGVILGQIVFSPITIDGTERGWHVLGPIAVMPERQRQGVGKALMRHGIERLRDIGSSGCVLVGDPGYYRQFGFRCDPRLLVPDVPAEYVMILPLGDEVPTGRIAFHDAFSAGAES